MTLTQPRLCAIHQPNLFPRLSTLAKLRAADVWVALDDVQFARRDYQHRARLGPRSDPSAQQWMSLSVALPSGRSTEIRDVRILDSETSRRRVARMTRQAHGRGQHWEPVGNVVDQVVHLMDQTDRLAEIAIASTQSLLELVGWTGEIVRSSDLVARTERSSRLADLTLAVGAAAYICGSGGSRYLDGDVFADLGLGVQYFSCPESGVWAGASRVSAIAALAEDGKAFLSETEGSRPQLSMMRGR
ncbi:WbqC family protein [Kribbella sp. NPDC051718]|uniref:WbqC family protein n=1 Tax=Kribbella sp. NPDC051718 TaxID=3155168 RepID=UPI0034466404